MGSGGTHIASRPAEGKARFGFWSNRTEEVGARSKLASSCRFAAVLGSFEGITGGGAVRASPSSAGTRTERPQVGQSTDCPIFLREIPRS